MIWHDRRILDLLDIEHPIIQAPMAGASNAELVAAVSEAAAERGDPDFIAMWAGQGVGLMGRRAAADLVNDLVVESQRLLVRLGQD